MRVARFLAPVLLTLALAGCASGPGLPAIPQTYAVTSGFFANSGMTIEADDGSFTLTGGESFTPPFQSNMYCQTCSARFFGELDVLNPAELLSAGGKRVTVKTSDGSTLNGILVLNQVFGPTQVGGNARLYNFYGPSLRSYELAIPQDRINQAKTGRVSVAYEVFADLPAQYSVTGQTRTYRSWILMLSRSPL